MPKMRIRQYTETTPQFRCQFRFKAAFTPSAPQEDRRGWEDKPLSRSDRPKITITGDGCRGSEQRRINRLKQLGTDQRE